MDRLAVIARRKALALGSAALAFGNGCQAPDGVGPRPFQLPRPLVARKAPEIIAYPTAPESELFPVFPLPKELKKVTLPDYVVEVSDVLWLESDRLVPLPPYRVGVGDVLFLFAPGAPEREPIRGYYPVDPDGTIHLGPGYGGRIEVVGQTAREIEAAVAERLRLHLRDPSSQVTVAQARSMPQIRGEFRVQPDGTVGLGTYGSVYVAGLALPKVKLAIERQLAAAAERPEVGVELRASHSKFVYVVADLGGAGEQVIRLPWSGVETVLDAVSALGRLPGGVGARVWVARPAPNGVEDQILPVDWEGVTRRGQTRTNYQLLPGDRVFVSSHAPIISGGSPTIFK